MKGVATVKTPSKSTRMRVPANWTFESAEIVDHFDEHVRETLPWYDLATNGVVHIARHYVTEGGTVVDVGASTGNIYNALRVGLAGRSFSVIGVEKSEEMVRRYAERNGSYARIWHADACAVEWENKDKFDVAIFFLTVMFVEPSRRRVLLARVFDAIKPGGAMIVVDRTVAEAGYPATVLWRLALAGKVAAGADPGDVVAKELSLAGAQRPIDPAILPSGAIEWMRFGDFAGWLIEKKEA